MAEAAPQSETVELIGSADAIRADWDALADRTGAALFLRPGWIEPWLEAFCRGEPAYLVARREGRLAGVLPLESRLGTLISAANWHTPLYGPVVEDERAAGAIARGLIEHAGRRADLWCLDPRAPGLAQLSAAAADAGYRTIVRTIARSPYVALEGSFDEFMAGRDRKFRKDIGRRWRRLEEAGGSVRFEAGSAELDELLSDGFRLEASGWKGEQGSAINSIPEIERFYRRVAHWAAERGWLRLAFLCVEDRRVAFDLAFEDGGALYVPKGGFDVDYRSLGPGQLLTYAGIRRAFEAGLRSYELLGQQDEYKRQWTDATRELLRCQAFPRSPGGSTTYLAWRYGRPLVQRIRGAGREEPV